jgi:hypothetical protein
MFFTRAIVALSVSAAALAVPFITNPVASTTAQGGQKMTITWQDSGSGASLKDFGPATVGIYAGNANQQAKLQDCGSVDVGAASSWDCNVDPSIGPNSNQYFIRMDSVSLKDATNKQFPAQSFSAKFSLAGMSGKFTDTVQKLIDGQSTAPIGGATSAAASPSGAAGASTTKLSTSVAPSGTSKSSAPTGSSSPKSGASGLVASGFAAALGAVAVVAML